VGGLDNCLSAMRGIDFTNTSVERCSTITEHIRAVVMLAVPTEASRDEACKSAALLRAIDLHPSCACRSSDARLENLHFAVAIVSLRRRTYIYRTSFCFSYAAVNTTVMTRCLQNS
jgi:hypothetical protein